MVWFGSNGLVRLLMVRFTVNKMSKINGSVHKFMVRFGYFHFGSAVRFSLWFSMNSPRKNYQVLTDPDAGYGRQNNNNNNNNRSHLLIVPATLNMTKKTSFKYNASPCKYSVYWFESLIPISFFLFEFGPYKFIIISLSH
jgi:hypothetical protein